MAAGGNGAVGAYLGAAAAVGVAGGCREGVQEEAKSLEGHASSSCLVAFPGEEAACGKDAAGRDRRGRRDLQVALVVVGDLGLALGRGLVVVEGSVGAASASSSSSRGAFAAAAAVAYA